MGSEIQFEPATEAPKTRGLKSLHSPFLSATGGHGGNYKLWDVLTFVFTTKSALAPLRNFPLIHPIPGLPRTFFVDSPVTLKPGMFSVR